MGHLPHASSNMGNTLPNSPCLIFAFDSITFHLTLIPFSDSVWACCHHTDILKRKVVISCSFTHFWVSYAALSHTKAFVKSVTTAVFLST